MCKNYRKNFIEDKRSNNAWYTCSACGKKMRLKNCTVDHIIPQKLIKLHTPDNLQPMCKHCNSSKGASLNKVATDYVRNNIDRVGNSVKHQLRYKTVRMPTARTISATAKAGGITGAVIGAGVETVSSTISVLNGEKDVVDAACDITYAGTKGGAAGYAGAAAGSLAASATASAIVASGIGTGLAAGGVAATAVAFAPVVVGFGAACAVGGLVCDIFDSIFD